MPDQITESKITINDFTRMLASGQNFSFTKFGDGEVRCMRNWLYGENIDGDKYNYWLSKSLKKAFINLAGRPNVYIGRWHVPALVEYLFKFAKKNGIKTINWVNYHFVMNASPIKGTTDFDSFSNDGLLNFVTTIKNSHRKKIFFSNGDNSELKEFFSADIFIETKKNNWSYEYDKYYKQVKEECKDGAILIIAAGMCSKVLISDLLNEFAMTCVDIGSGFDLIATGKYSRPWSHSYEDEMKYYKSILPVDW